MAKATTTTKKTTTAKKTATKKTTTAKLTAKEIMAMLKSKYDEVYDDDGVYSIKLNGKWDLQMPVALLRLSRVIPVSKQIGQRI